MSIARLFTHRISLVLLMMFAVNVCAHETDQFTLPPGREFADLGPMFSRWAYRLIDRAVERTNRDIRGCITNGSSAEAIADAQDPQQIVSRVSSQMPWALEVIEGLEHTIVSQDLRDRFPGKVVSSRAQFQDIYLGANLPFDPRQFIRLFHSSTIKVYGVHLGTDKVGHFTDMGMNYYRSYRSARAAGKSEEEAQKAGIVLGTWNPILSERGFLGFVTAGSFSNADLVANYTGMLFYKNLTEPTMLKGKVWPAMVQRDGEYWMVADHVRRDSDFFSLFISEHFDESLNPSVFDPTLRTGIRRNVRNRGSRVLQRHADEFGNRRPKAWFEAKQKELSTYWGIDYGFKGTEDELVTIANSCFAEERADETPATALLRAAAGGDAEALKGLVGKADVNAAARGEDLYSSEWGNRAIHLAARNGQAESVKALVAAGADVNAGNDRGMTALHRSVHDGKLTAEILSLGAKADARDVRGRTALHLAASREDAGAVAALLTKGASSNDADHNGRTALHYAAESGGADAVSHLVRGGANISAADRHQITPLHLAAARKDTGALKALLEHKTPVNAADQFGRTALHEAARAGSEEGAQMLIEAGAEVKAVDAYGNTPLHLACRGSRERMAKLLLARGADVNAKNTAGNTALHDAAFARDKRVTGLLVAYKADAAAMNRAGQTAEQLAKMKGRGAAERLLEKFGEGGGD